MKHSDLIRNINAAKFFVPMNLWSIAIKQRRRLWILSHMKLG